MNYEHWDHSRLSLDPVTRILQHWLMQVLRSLSYNLRINQATNFLFGKRLCNRDGDIPHHVPFAMWALWRLKSPAHRLLIQDLVHANNKRKHWISAILTLRELNHRCPVVHLAKGQYCGKGFHVMTSSSCVWRCGVVAQRFCKAFVQ